MFGSQFKFGLACALVFLSLWTFAPGSRQIVLCFGEDGHVAFEPSHGINCESEAGSAHEGSCFQEQHHDDCVDLLLSLQQHHLVTTPGKKLAAKDARPFATPNIECELPSNSFVSAIPVLRPDPYTAPSEVVRHTVLLI